MVRRSHQLALSTLCVYASTAKSLSALSHRCFCSLGYHRQQHCQTMPQMTKVPFSSSSNRALRHCAGPCHHCAGPCHHCQWPLGSAVLLLRIPLRPPMSASSVPGCIGSLRLLQCPQSDCSQGWASLPEGGPGVARKRAAWLPVPAGGFQAFRKGLSDSHSRPLESFTENVCSSKPQ